VALEHAGAQPAAEARKLGGAHRPWRG
jgi:hypothetical protein